MMGRPGHDPVLQLRAELAVESSPEFARRVRAGLAGGRTSLFSMRRLIPAAATTTVVVGLWWSSAATPSPMPSLSVSGSMRGPWGDPVTLSSLEQLGALHSAAVGLRVSRAANVQPDGASAAAEATAVDVESRGSAVFGALAPFEAAVWTVTTDAPFQSIEFQAPDIRAVEFPKVEFAWVELPALPVTSGTPLPDRSGKEMR